ncbi:hypothetical protein [Paenibacillus sp.]|uniref:hypothetical protein n=1 Tax=Paenibacillus sp. TaxID=58172 RepID=UPI002827E0A4|nr:hypothetical protein [Paenibacillus sp.]MDR0268359.1 hypothetical protein [Paenibacillus sp.]
MINQIGRRIYYLKSTGVIIQDTGERTGLVFETTITQDFETYTSLKECVPESVGMLQFEYGQYSEDFAKCNRYYVNVETMQLEFSYPDSNKSEPDNAEASFLL